MVQVQQDWTACMLPLWGACTIIDENVDGIPPRRPGWVEVDRDLRYDQGIVPLDLPSCYIFGMSRQVNHNCRNAEGQAWHKPCLVTSDTGASVMIARLDIIVGLPKRKLA